MNAKQQNKEQTQSYIRYSSILAEKDKALLFSITRNVTTWLPKSQMEFVGKDVVKIPLWLATKKGFITICPERMLSPTDVNALLTETKEQKLRHIDI